ncbi:MAG: hypothetical protein F4087_02800 [Gemmatimonadetes bacterium]|nr:hypothetical protein [Gemmatimonadota bacterium]MYE69274.1 hypothetical protein [Gemmatimonadota bacterium]MYJ67429.1 hypothetical protein [Gemmatimonadota bacterium]
MKRLAIPTMFMALAACATASEAGPEAEPITIRVDNMTSRVITVERYIGSTIARRVGLVNGQSQRVLTIPWHPSRPISSFGWKAWRALPPAPRLALLPPWATASKSVTKVSAH